MKQFVAVLLALLCCLALVSRLHSDVKTPLQKAVPIRITVKDVQTQTGTPLAEFFFSL